MRKYLLFSVFLLFAQPTHARPSKADSVRNAAQRIIDTLSSPYFFGRGYLKDGMQKAAGFVADEFKTTGLTPLQTSGSYFQTFGFPVNKIESLSIQLIEKRKKKKWLKTGADFIPSAGFTPDSGTYKLVFVKKKNLKNRHRFDRFKNKINKKELIVLTQKVAQSQRTLKRMIQDLKRQAAGAAGLIETERKLTWTVSQSQDSLIRLYFLDGSISKKAKSITIDGKSLLDKRFQASNVIGMVRGKIHPDSFIVFSAHYDHLGGIGDSVYFPGANDNASGTAMLLTLAKYYALPQHQPDYSIVFMSFAAEEAGLLGSFYFVEHPELNLNKVKFLINLDMVGYGKPGITVVNATVYSKQFEQLEKINSQTHLLTQIKKRGPAANSDHYPFYKAGVPCFFIYTLGGVYYHDIFDTSKVVTLYAFPDLFYLLTNFVKTF